ncbi:hypothetical protein LCGC14_2957500, partial [marine sediment metagenome]
MGISDRVEGSVEKWRKKWGSPLKKFAGEFIQVGLKAGLED